MSSVARQLCDEINQQTHQAAADTAECNLPTPTSTPTHRTHSCSRGTSFKNDSSVSTKSIPHQCSHQSKCGHSSSTADGKPTRLLIIEKKKVINKLLPRDFSASRSVINEFTSKEILMKKRFRDIAVNTNLSKVHKANVGCMTLIQRRERDSGKPCTCNNNGGKAAKEMQTYDTLKFDRFDKACSHSILNSECGTEPVLPELVEVFTAVNPQVNVKVETGWEENYLTKNDQFTHNLRHNKKSNMTPQLDFMGARRWAITKYPTRGPDF